MNTWKVQIPPSNNNQFLSGISLPPRALRTSWLRIPPTTAATPDESEGTSFDTKSRSCSEVQIVAARERFEIVSLTVRVNSSSSSIVGFLPFASIQESKAILSVVSIRDRTKAQREQRRHFSHLSRSKSLPKRSEKRFLECTISFSFLNCGSGRFDVIFVRKGIIEERCMFNQVDENNST